MSLHREEATVEDIVLPIACEVHPVEVQEGEDMAIALIETGIATDITMRDHLPVVVPPHEMTTGPVVEVATALLDERHLPLGIAPVTITEQFLLVPAMVAVVVLDHDRLLTVPPVVLHVDTMEEVDRMNIEIEDCHLLDPVEPGAPRATVIEGEVQNGMSTEEMIVDIAHERKAKGRITDKNQSRTTYQ